MTRFYIEKAQYDRYDKLTRDPRSLLKGKRFADVFLLATVLGFVRGRRESLKKRREVADIKVFGELGLWLLRSIAFLHKFRETNDVDDALKIVKEVNDVIKIAEEYAKEGLSDVEEMVMSTEGREKIEDLAEYILDRVLSEIPSLRKFLEQKS